jgi:RimJ/RimL family protein N-acetyltransferase
MNEVARLSFRALTQNEAHDIVAGQRAGHTWAADYPTPGDFNVAHAALAGNMAFASDSMPWGLYVVVENASGMSIGGVGFVTAPNQLGEAEIGYGICQSSQGKGVATEAVLAMCEFARGRASALLAETVLDNLASQRVLEKTGFEVVGKSDDLIYWRKALDPLDDQT